MKVKYRLYRSTDGILVVHSDIRCCWQRLYMQRLLISLASIMSVYS